MKRISAVFKENRQILKKKYADPKHQPFRLRTIERPTNIEQLRAEVVLMAFLRRNKSGCGSALLNHLPNPIWRAEADFEHFKQGIMTKKLHHAMQVEEKFNQDHHYIPAEIHAPPDMPTVEVPYVLFSLKS